MKSIWRIILMAGLAGAFLCMNVNAQANTLQVRVENKTVHIIVNTENPIENLAVQVYDAKKEQLCYMMQTSDFSVQSDDEGYRYSFDFVMHDKMATDTYIASAGAVDMETMFQSFKFVHPEDKIRFLNALDAVDESEIFEFLKENEAYVSIDISDYINMETTVRVQIDQLLADLDVKCDSESLGQAETLFFDHFHEWIEIGQLFTLTGEQWNDQVEQAISDGILEGKYYAKLDFSHVFGAFTALTERIVNKEMLGSEFHVACLIAAAEDVDFTTFGEMLDYYDQLGSIQLDKTYWNQLSQDQQVQAWKEIKKAKFTNADTLADLFYEISFALANLPSGSGSGSGHSSGGGGGGGGGSSSSSIWMDDMVVQQAPTDPAQPDAAVQFVDLEQAAWAEESILYLAEKGIINGDGNGHFYPNNSITREEFVKIISDAFALTDETAASSFFDVNERWSEKYVASVERLGIVRGISETEFDPTGGLIRQDMAQIIYKIYRMAGYEENTASAIFQDQDKIADYAKNAVNVLYNAGIVNGTGENFEPRALVTRAQAAKIVYSLLLMEEVG